MAGESVIRGNGLLLAENQSPLKVRYTIWSQQRFVEGTIEVLRAELVLSSGTLQDNTVLDLQFEDRSKKQIVINRQIRSKTPTCDLSIVV